MLTIVVPETEYYDEPTNRFIKTKTTTVNLEHSLISLSKWESRWCKHFVGNKTITKEETYDYFKCMIVDKNIPDSIVYSFNIDNINAINAYIDAPMTATTIDEPGGKGKGRNEIITSELIYYAMVANQIPFECQKWHLNRLIMLIRVCTIKNTPPKKMSKRAILSNNTAINKARQKQLNTKG